MTKSRIWILSAAATGLLLAAACTASQADDESLVMGTFERNADGYADITVEQLADILEVREVPVINVHIPFEGEIPGTEDSIAFDEIAEHLDQLPGKDEPVILYCRSGSMSTTAAEVLASLGYTQVAEVDGGMRAWAAAGYDLIGRQGW
jgi:rhodanese-related sulfurtransferase